MSGGLERLQSLILTVSELTGLPGYVYPQTFIYCGSENINQGTNPSSGFPGVQKEDEIKLRICMVRGSFGVTSATEDRGRETEHVCLCTHFMPVLPRAVSLTTFLTLADLLCGFCFPYELFSCHSCPGRFCQSLHFHCL